MVSPEILRRYSFFAGMGYDTLVALAREACEEKIGQGDCFFHEGDDLKKFYLILEGAVSIDIAVPDPEFEQKLSSQIVGDLTTKGVTVSTVGTGDVFGWSALIPPNTSSATAVAVTPCRVVAFDRETLLSHFQKDPKFGYLMTQKIAQVIRERLRDMRIESLAFVTDKVT